jgi:hypothetical protein
VNDPWAARVVPELDVGVMQDRVDERPSRMPRCRMHHQARGLVDDDQMIVLEQDVERDVFGQRVRNEGRSRFDTHADAGTRLVLGAACRASGRDAALFHPALHRRARQAEGSRRQHFV